MPNECSLFERILAAIDKERHNSAAQKNPKGCTYPENK